MRTKPLVVTAGEPAGIGPELCLSLAQSPWADQIVVIADPDMLAERANLLGQAVALKEYSSAATAGAGELLVLPQPLANDAVCGELDPANAQGLLDGLDRAIDGCLSERHGHLYIEECDTVGIF